MEKIPREKIREGKDQRGESQKRDAGSKSRLAKAAGAEPAGQMRNENLRAVAARSTFASQNAQNFTCSYHFWKSKC